MAICCLLLLALAASLRGALGITPDAQPNVSSAPWWLWGAALGGFAYLAAVAISLSTGVATYTDTGFGCIGARDISRLAVPYEFIASRWLSRSLLFVALSVAMAAAAVASSLHRGLEWRPASQGQVLMGAGGMWLLLSIADHLGFGLYAIRAQAGWSHWLVHGVGVAGLALGLAIALESPRVSRR